LEKYRDISKQEGFEDKYQEDTEKALTRTGGFKKNAFKGDCCGAVKRLVTECWENSANKEKRPSFYKSPNQRSNSGGNNTGTVCGYCNKKGHEEKACIKKKRDQGSSNPESAESMLISADFFKNNSTGSAGNNEEKLEQDYFDHIPGTKQVLSNKEDNQGSKTLGLRQVDI
jgi:hypothetical protein